MVHSVVRERPVSKPLQQANSVAIFTAARRIFARLGYDGLRMRFLATEVGIPLSVLYYYYPSKDALLDEIFHSTTRELGIARQSLLEVATASEALLQRIRFQLDHSEEVVAVLKYYLHFRELFARRSDGFLPEKAALHIEEVLERGLASGEFAIENMSVTAKVVSHAINGFVLEYFPCQLSAEDSDTLVSDIGASILRGLR